LPELPNLTASAALVDDHFCSYSTICCCHVDEIVNRALKMARSEATVEDRSCAPECKIIQLGENQSLKWHADSAEGLVIEIPSGLQDEANRPCKVAWAFRIEDQQAWCESGRCSITPFSHPRTEIPLVS
jgi:Alpha-L-fucosidase C-terminal domain